MKLGSSKESEIREDNKLLMDIIKASKKPARYKPGPYWKNKTKRIYFWDQKKISRILDILLTNAVTISLKTN